ncbi:MAG: serine hydrolase domain-containing protein [Acidobacteriota bacterium]
MSSIDKAQLGRIEDHLRRRYVDPGKIAGAVTLVAHRGQVELLEALGQRDLERAVPMATDSLFRIYSMTKPITSVTLMSLYEEGHFQLDDPVHRWIPAWKDQRVYRWGVYPNFVTEAVARPMTVRDLLMHTAGLTYGFMACSNVDAAYREIGVETAPKEGDLSDMVEKLAGLPLEFSPGDAWNYSVATDICGHLIEVMTGQSLDQVFAERIFNPLGMKDTGFFVPSSEVDRFTACYERNAAKELVLQDDPQSSRYLAPPSLLSGGGGLVSTAEDYFRFCQMLLEGGSSNGQRVLGRKTIEFMTRNHLPAGSDLAGRARGSFSETTYDGVGFGLGFAVTLDPTVAQSIGSAGEYFWGGAASTIFWIDPEEELVVVFLTQLMPSGTFNFRGQLKSIVYPALS